MVTAQPRTRTPFDIEMTAGGTTMPFMLAENETGLAYKRALIDEIVAQQRTDTFSYQHRDPRLDLPASFEAYDFGAGFEDAVEAASLGFRGYNYTQGIDLSWFTRGYLGPQKQTGGGFTGAPTRFFWTSLGLFGIDAGNDALREWTGSSWTVRDLGIDDEQRITDLIEYRSSTYSVLLASMTGGTYYYTFDGVLWTKVEATPSTPAYRDSTVASTTGAVSLTPAEPTSAAEDDVLIAAILGGGVATPEDPGFWAEVPNFGQSRTVDDATNDSAQLIWYWGRRGGSAPSYQFNFESSTKGIAVVAAYSGCTTSGSPIDDNDTLAQGSDAETSHTASPLTTTFPNTLGIYVCGLVGAATFTAPSGASEREDATVGVGIAAISLSLADEAHAAIETIGTQTFTSSAGGGSRVNNLNLIGNWEGPIRNERFIIRGSATGSPVLWAIDSRGGIRNSVAPLDSGSWSAADAIQVGQANITIAGIHVIDNVFYVVHDGGITSYDGTTVSTVWAAKTLTVATDQAEPAIGPDNRLYFAFSDSLLRLDTETNTVEKVWPRGPQIGNAELNGTITALAFDDGRGYFAIKNSAGNYYILKFDPSYRVRLGDDEDSFIWPVHTLYYNSTGAIGALAVVPASSSAMSSTNPQLVMGDGTTADYLILPKPGLRPEDDSAYRYDTTADRIAYGSFVNFRAQGFPKWLTRGDIEAKTTTTETIAAQYQVPAGTATALVTANTAQTGRTTATLSTPVSVTRVRYKALMNTSGATLSPVLRGLVLHAASNPPRDEGIVLTVHLKDEIESNHDGVLLRHTPANQEAFLFDNENSIITITDLRKQSFTMKMLNCEYAGVRYDGDGKLETFIQVTLGQLTS